VNKRLAKYEERKKALVKQSGDFLDAAEKEERDLNEDEQSQLDANKVELEGLAKKIEWEHQLSPHVSSPKADPIGDDFGLSLADVSNPVAAWEKDPKKGFADPQDFLCTIIESGRTGVLDERLNFMATAGSDEAGTYADPYGGFLIPEGLAPGILRVAPEVDPIGSRVTKVPMTNPIVRFNARTDKDHSSSVSGGLTVARRAETQTQAASRTVYEQVTLNAHALFGLSYATEEILERSPVSFAAILEAGFRDQFQSHLIDERINGTGVGEFEGVMNCPALVTVAIDGDEAGQDADTIVYGNLTRMRARCWGYGNAVWLANHDTLPNLMRIVFPGTLGGFPVWQTSAREGEPDILFGRPVILTEYCQTIGDLGDIILINWSQYLEGTYKPLRSADSIHVRFVNHERTFKFWIENDGRGWWRSALTPKNSTTTLSPFVALAERA